jgi:hypothetical protein
MLGAGPGPDRPGSRGRPRIGFRRRGCPRVCSRGVLAAAQSEEAGPVPAGSGDLAGDGRQARKDLSLPAEAARDDQNLVQLALIFPNDDGSDLYMPGRRALSAGRGAEEFAKFAARIEARGA